MVDVANRLVPLGLKEVDADRGQLVLQRPVPLQCTERPLSKTGTEIGGDSPIKYRLSDHTGTF